LTDLLSGLNVQQREAVKATEGPLLILAGAGSGKTRVLVYRFAYLLQEKGASPWEILALTFTNKAAEEMAARVYQLTGANNLFVSTFHAASARWLRREAKLLGYKDNFVIVDPRDQKRIITQVLKEINLDPKRFSPQALLATISAAKNELIDCDRYRRQAGDFYEEKAADVYQHYQEKLKQGNAMDFDDLLMKTVELFSTYPQVLSFYQDRFRYIMVDEYQDTNYAQYTIVKMLADKHRNLCVVGDDDQSIYRFRGADIRNILNFEKDYPEAKVVKLEENYRSTQQILDAANAVVSGIEMRKEKRLWTKNPQGEPVTVFQGENEFNEAAFVIETIRKLMPVYSRFAVLYRTNAQSRVLEEMLVREGISYKVFGGLRFYERKEIKDLIAYLSLLVNPDDDVSLERVINVPPRGIGTKTLEGLRVYARKMEISAGAALATVEAAGMGKFATKRLQDFHLMIQGLREMEQSLSLRELVEQVLEQTGYKLALEEENTIESRSRLENLEEFLGMVSQFQETSGGDDGLLDFLSQAALMSSTDDRMVEDEPEVILMTLHSAKGLEFPVVFIVGMEEGIFPHYLALEDEEQLQEERRLCYVGLTRAQERLFLTYTRTRNLYGRAAANQPSRFLNEIPAGCWQKAGSTIFQPGYQSRGRTKQIKKMFNWQTGDRVSHGKFGEGEILSIKEVRNDLLLEILFPRVGKKQLLAGYAPLKKI